MQSEFNRKEIGKKQVSLFGDYTITQEENAPYYPTAEYLMRSLAAPLTVAWDVTNACNLTCQHCFNHSGSRREDELNEVEAMQLVDQLISMEIFNVCLCGGEPLLRPDLFKIIDRLAAENVLISMVSNGWLLDQEKAKRIAGGGVKFLQISIDGLTAVSHDRLRGRDGSFDRAIRAAEAVAATNIDLAVAFCPTRFNIPEFPDYIKMAHQLGAKMVRMMPLLRMGRALEYRDEILPTQEQMAEFAMMVQQLTLDYMDRDLYIEWGDPLEHFYLFPRNEAKLFILHLHANGDIGISAYLPLVFGNVRERPIMEYWNAGLKDVWRHPKVVDYANRLLCLEDLAELSPVPWVEENAFVDVCNF